MKRKTILGILALVLVAGAVWFARSGAPSDDASDETFGAAGGAASTNIHARRGGGPGPNEADQTRRFKDFTPEQRVEFARKGRGPGG